jgi:hypothetical protein
LSIDKNADSSQVLNCLKEISQYHTDRGGNIYDHFTIEFEYENGVRMTSMCRQIKGTGTKIGEEIVGTKGRGAMVGRNRTSFGDKLRSVTDMS